MMILSCHYFVLNDTADAWNEDGFHVSANHSRFGTLAAWRDHQKVIEEEKSIWESQCETCLWSVNDHAPGCPDVSY